MAYKTYITDALVCGSTHHNTSDKLYHLFTREAGMLLAHARSVREERSKQRYALQDFSFVRATLIRGKSMWRIAGVEPIKNTYQSSGERDMRGFYRSSILFLRRVIQGETPERDLYDDVEAHFMHGMGIAADVLSISLFYRVLHRLGYIAPQEEYQEILDFPSTPIGISCASAKAEQYKEALRDEIKIALEESHL